MKKLLMAWTLVGTAVAGFAQDEAKAEALPAVQKPARVSFTALPRCSSIEGEVEVRKPGGEWIAAEEGLYYPHGTSFRTDSRGRLVLSFSPDSSVTLAGDSEIATKLQPVGGASRTISLVRGTVELKLADNLPEGAFFVTAPSFTVKNPAGESRYVYRNTSDGDEVTVRCLTGSLAINGRHFEIPAMRAANEIRICSNQDYLITRLYGTSGDYVVRLDHGLQMKGEFGDDGKLTMSEAKGSRDWRLSPATKIIISRAVPAIGERMSVHVMAFDAAGERKSECYFCEGRSEVNSGELVRQEKSDGAEQAKKAAEATETTAATDVEETTPENKKTSQTTND